jgi:hypothetical protein
MKTSISKPWILLLPSLWALAALEAEEELGAGVGKAAGREREALVLERTRLAGGLLGSNLLAAISRSGVTGAVEFCSVGALELTRSAGTNDGTGVRRVSHKPRNPANRADEGELRVLEDLRGRLVSGGGTPVVLTTNASGQVSGFAPIQLGQPLCLKCHGQPDREIAPSTLEVLRRLYPEDKATGFRLGELRGMWRVDLPH